MINILIVEDDYELQLFYKKVLERLGFDALYFAKNGAEAVKKYKDLSIINRKPDLILMDYQMPIKNGFEAAKEILEIDKTAQIIFVSSDLMIKNKALSLGAYGFLCKPFKLEDLTNVLNRIFLEKNENNKC